MSFSGNCLILGSTIPSNPLYQPLINATRKILKALPSPKHMAFHAELWHSKDGEIIFCEIASRTGGAMISSTIDHCFNINIDKEWLYAECGLAQLIKKPLYQPCGWVNIPPLNGVLEYIPSGNEPNCVRITEHCGAIGERYYGGVKSGLFLAGYVIDGKSEEEVAMNIAHVAAWFKDHAKWQLAS